MDGRDGQTGETGGTARQELVLGLAGRVAE